MARPTPTKQAIATGSDTVNGASRVAGAGVGAKVVGSRVPQAAALLGNAAGTAGRVASGLARVSPVLLAANAVGGALKGGHDAYERGGSTGDIAKGAAWGAADQVTVGLASWAYGEGAEVGKIGAAHAAGFGSGTPSAATQYDAMGNVTSTGGAPQPSPSALPGMMKLGGPKKSASDMSNAELHAQSVQSSMDSMKAGGGYADDRDVHNEIAKRIFDGRMTPAEQQAHSRDWGKRVMPNSVDKTGNWKPGAAERAVQGERKRQMVPRPEGGLRPQSSLSPQQTQAFKTANQHYTDAHMMGATEKTPPTYGPNGNGKRGFQIGRVQAAAQAAKGNQYDGGDDDA